MQASRTGQSGEGRTRTESANVLFKGRAYCRLVVSSHSALIDSTFQEGIVVVFSLSHALSLSIYEAWYIQQCQIIKEKVRHVLLAVCW